MPRLPWPLWSRDDPPAREDDFWDAVVRGGRPDIGIDPALMEAIDRVHRLDDAPGPDSAFVARLKEDLVHTHAIPVSLQPTRINPNGRAAPPPWRAYLPELPVSKERRRWAIAQFATAILLLVTLFGGYLTFVRPGQQAGRSTLSGASISAPAISASVPMYGNDPGRTSVMPGPGPSGAPVTRWRFNLGQGITGSPAIVDGVAFIGRGITGNDDDRSGAVYAVDTATGAELWEVETTRSVETSPIVWNDMVYVADTGGTLYALDAGSGAERWRLALGGGYSQEAVIADGVLYIATAIGEENSTGVAVAGSLVIVGSSPADGASTTTLYALDAGSGKERWRADSFAADSAGYYAFDAHSGVQKWTIPTAEMMGAPAVSDTTLYFADNVLLVHGSILRAVDIETGQERWHHTEGDQSWGRSPALANGMVFVTTVRGSVFALDEATGNELWRVKLPVPYIATSPAVVGDVLYVATMRGVVFALATSDGAELWRYAIDGAWQMHSSPAIIGGVIYLGDYEANYDGYLYALGDPLGPATATSSPSS